MVEAQRKNVGALIDHDLADRFEALARQRDGSVAAALRRMIGEAVQGSEHHAISSSGRGRQVSVRFKDAEREALAAAAGVRGTTPSNWLRSLALVHLTRRPMWSPKEIDALRELAGDIRAIGNNVNQIARALNVAVQSGFYPPHQGGAAREAGILVRHEMRRIAAILSGNFDYWGLPDAERPTAAPGAIERAAAETRAAKQKRRARPIKRPARTGDD